MHWYLLPLSLIYGLVITLRNLLFNYNWLKSTKFNLPVISIGNITVGGTGKTPHIEYLIALLEKKYNLAIISRGYKRNTKGYFEVTLNSKSNEVGDEPLQMKQKFENCTVVVDEKRAHAINHLLKQTTKPQIVLLDDAYQHRHVNPSLNILLVDYNRPITNDFMMPTGLLREPACNIKRSDIILVTKCKKDLTPLQMTHLAKKLKIKPYQKIFFTAYNYGQLRSVFENITAGIELKSLVGKQVLAIAGIANPNPFYAKIKELNATVLPLTFPDHYNFKKDDIWKIRDRFNQINDKNKIIVCTEKDAIRIKTGDFSTELSQLPVYYLPIEVEFINNESVTFNQIVENHIASFKRAN